MSVDRGILPVGEQAQVSAVAKRANGEAIDFSKEGSLTFASSDEDVAAVDANGVITGVGDGIARIKATAELNGVVKENTVVLLVGTGASEDAMAVSSPSNTNSIIFTQNADGGVEYFVTANGKIAMNASATGLDTNLGDFSTGLTYVGREDQVIDETYDMISGKQSTFVNKANESTFKFMKGDIQYNIVARAYDDGVAFQYQIIAEDGQELIFNSENTTFNVPENSETYVQPGGSNCYEKKYEKKQLSELRGDYGMTFLYKTPSDVWVMLSEARHTPQYTGLAIKADGSTVLKGVFSWDQGNTKPSTTAPFVSPWRVAVLDTAAKIATHRFLKT